jgi:hypothetical protein
VALTPHATRRLGRAIAGALAVAAIAVPCAHASGPRDKYGPLDPWASHLVQQAGKYGPLDPWAANLIRRRSHVAREAARDAVAPRSEAADGFDWVDAAVGAGSAFILMLFGAGVLKTARRTRGHVARVGS